MQNIKHFDCSVMNFYYNLEIENMACYELIYMQISNLKLICKLYPSSIRFDPLCSPYIHPSPNPFEH